MAGHSKWSKVKHIKGPLDIKRGAQSSKLVKESTVVARLAGGGLFGDPRLRSVVEIATKKGTSELEGAHYNETLCESYAPGGVAMTIEAATDNKNRPAADLRFIFSKNGSLAASYSVLHRFHEKGRITIPRSLTQEDCILELTLDVGAEKNATEDTRYVLTTLADRLYAVAEVLRAGGIEANLQKHTSLSDNTVPIHDEGTAAQVLRLYETLEDNDDTQNVYSHFDIPEEVVAWLPA